MTGRAAPADGTHRRAPDGFTRWPDIEPLEVQISSGQARLAIDLRGGNLRRLVVGDWDVLDGYPAGTIPAGRRGGVLLPWPNRLSGGRYDWRGSTLQLDVAAPDRPTASHGLLSWQRWSELARIDGAATVGTVLEARPGYPFRLAVAVDYTLAPDHLRVTVRVRNVGDQPAPFGVGMHPYLYVGAASDGGIGDSDLNIPARTAADVADGLPTGRRSPFDGAIGRIGDRALDTPLTDLIRDKDGWARLRLRGSVGELVLGVDKQWPWLQVYSGDTLPEGQRRRSLAVEPMTCPANALATGTDLLVLEPSADWAGSWMLNWSAADRTRADS